MTVPRAEAPTTGTEREQLLGFLDYHRATLAQKCAGLGAGQLRHTLAPSTMNLGGLLKHSALNETYWFSCRFAGRPEGRPWDTIDWDADPDWDWHSASADSPQQLLELWQTSIAHARTAIEGAGLDDIASTPRRDGSRPNLRWIIVHMIEEYARHNGHADLIRESIDGVTGE